MSHHTDPGRFVLTPPTPEQQRAAGITCADIALRIGDVDGLGEVLQMLGLKDTPPAPDFRDGWGQLGKLRASRKGESGDSAAERVPRTALGAHEGESLPGAADRAPNRRMGRRAG
jgi:hypothetical protein